MQIFGLCRSVAFGLAAMLVWTLASRSTMAQVTSSSDSGTAIGTRLTIKIPMSAAGSKGLEAWLYLPATEGKHPLVLLSHPGDNGSKKDREEMGPGIMEPEARWFVRRGWAVAVVMRRGFGASGGTFQAGTMYFGQPGLENTYHEPALDLVAAFDALTSRPDIDAAQVIAVGNRRGGLISIAFGVMPLSRLKAVVDVAGPWDWGAFSAWAAKSHKQASFSPPGPGPQVPMLWLYAKNDSGASAKYVEKIYSAWKTSGREADLVMTENSGDDGSKLFEESPKLWGPVLESFLATHHLPYAPLSPDPAPSVVKLSDQFDDRVQNAFKRFQTLGSCKAFAVSPTGGWAYSYGKRTLEQAKREAVNICGPSYCSVIAVGE